jgi:hypothetical protein
MGGGEAATSASFMQAFAVYGSHNLFSESFIECYQGLFKQAKKKEILKFNRVKWLCKCKKWEFIDKAEMQAL